MEGFRRQVPVRARVTRWWATSLQWWWVFHGTRRPNGRWFSMSVRGPRIRRAPKLEWRAETFGRDEWTQRFPCPDTNCIIFGDRLRFVSSSAQRAFCGARAESRGDGVRMRRTGGGALVGETCDPMTEKMERISSGCPDRKTDQGVRGSRRTVRAEQSPNQAVTPIRNRCALLKGATLTVRPHEPCPRHATSPRSSALLGADVTESTAPRGGIWSSHREVLARATFLRTGKWSIPDLEWHVFSCGDTPCKAEREGLRTLSPRNPMAFYVWPEDRQLPIFSAPAALSCLWPSSTTTSTSSRTISPGP